MIFSSICKKMTYNVVIWLSLLKVLLLLCGCVASHTCDNQSPSSRCYSKSDLILNSFSIKTNTITRTSESLSGGAKYLMEADKSSNEQCILWCWENRNCTLAVYEERSQGSCYLFDCGPPEQMRCKFTGHDNYTSSIIKFTRADDSPDTNDIRNQVKHESDLVKLRANSVVSKSSQLIGNINKIEGNSPQAGQNSITSTTSGILIPPPSGQATITSTSASTSTNACKRHQFKCRNSSDCIAIYNVCDGIAQCSDGSDEDASLNCPNSNSYSRPDLQSSDRQQQQSRSVSGMMSNSASNRHEQSMARGGGGGLMYGQANSPNEISRNSDENIMARSGHEIDHYNGPKKAPQLMYNYAKSPDSNKVLVDQIKDIGYGNKQPLESKYTNIPVNDFVTSSRNQISSGEAKNPYYPSNQFNGIPDGPMGGGQAFGDSYYGQSGKDFYPPAHKSRIIGENDYLNYPLSLPSSYNFPYRQRNDDQRPTVIDRSDDIMDFIRRRVPAEPTFVGSEASRQLVQPVQQSPPPSTGNNNLIWQQGSIGANGGGVAGNIPGYPARMDSYPNGNMESPLIRDNKIEGPLRGMEKEPETRPTAANFAPTESQIQIRRAKNSQHSSEIVTKQDTINNNNKAINGSHPPPSTSTKQVRSFARLNADKLTHSLNTPIAISSLNINEPGRDTNSAVIALALSLVITSMLVALAIYRMRYIRRRIARRGHKNLAHDADYLVNGMYL
ncbi:uncharacterized protein LOC141856803 [Brevipalpus obovatus]|uniref:uncharacterized protein LOC141856803 n=1 Tax=Brevipalpus obovatus TaxID=246614 RepID=UPI003D9EA695